MTAIQPLKTGNFPHQAYRPSCQCINGKPEPTKNYTGHPVAPPTCSECGARYQLDIKLVNQ